ncbi:MAG: DNA polymerase III subunit beta, partial [Bacteroidetes bacterium]|nr:DNA polymerase III subunit beta [Bacteroidota bacterium]
MGRATLTSIHSLSIAASKDDVAPVITQLMLRREGDALRAVATD